MAQNKFPIPQAMKWKYGATCSKNAAGDGIETWTHPSITKPNQIQLMRDLEEYEAFVAATDYQAKRHAEYPPIADQLDAIWKGGADMEAMREKILAVKAKYPKPAQAKE